MQQNPSGAARLVRIDLGALSSTCDGHDLLKGGAGADTIDGGLSDDIITGDRAAMCWAAARGADTFNYTRLLDGHNLIEGFAAGQDRLDLTQLLDGLGVPEGDRRPHLDHG